MLERFTPFPSQLLPEQKCPFPHRGERTNLKSLIDNFRLNGYPEDATLPIGENPRYRDNHAQLLLDVYALSTFPIATGVQAAYEKSSRQPGHARAASFHDAASSIKHITENAIGLEIFYGKRSEDMITRRNMEALEALTRTFTGKNASDFIDTGVCTAAGTIGSVLNIIPPVVQRDSTSPITKEQLLDVATGTYPLVVSLAKLSLGDFSVTKGNLTDHMSEKQQRLTSLDQWFDPNDFKVEDSKLMLAQHASERVRDTIDTFNSSGSIKRHSIIFDTGEKITTGCPALYSPAFKTMWDWHLEYARNIYREPVPSHQTTVLYTRET